MGRPARPTASPAEGSALLGGWLMLGGGAAVVVGALVLPWYSASGPAGSVTVKGLSGSGFGVLILAGFAIAKGLQAVAPDRVQFRLGTPLLTGALLLVLVGFRWSELNSALNEARAIPGVTASIGAGFWLAAAGAVAVLGGGLLLQFGARERH